MYEHFDLSQKRNPNLHSSQLEQSTSMTNHMVSQLYKSNPHPLSQMSQMTTNTGPNAGLAIQEPPLVPHLTLPPKKNAFSTGVNGVVMPASHKKAHELSSRSNQVVVGPHLATNVKEVGLTSSKTVANHYLKFVGTDPVMKTSTSRGKSTHSSSKKDIISRNKHLVSFQGMNHSSMGAATDRGHSGNAGHLAQHLASVPFHHYLVGKKYPLKESRHDPFGLLLSETNRASTSMLTGHLGPGIINASGGLSSHTTTLLGPGLNGHPGSPQPSGSGPTRANASKNKKFDLLVKKLIENSYHHGSKKSGGSKLGVSSGAHTDRYAYFTEQDATRVNLKGLFHPSQQPGK